MLGVGEGGSAGFLKQYIYFSEQHSKRGLEGCLN